MSHLAIFALGPLRIELDGQPLQTSRHKALALLVYLAMNPEKQSRAVLSALLWPDYEQEKAYAYLRRTLWELRSLLGEGWLEASREDIRLDRQADVYLDVAEFQTHLAAFRQHGHPETTVCQECLAHLHTAALLYRGDFLAGFNLRDSPGFEDWQFFQGEELRQAYANALQTLASLLYQEGAFTEAAVFARLWLALDTLNEEAHRLLMKIFDSTGQHHLALRQYQECQRILKTDLGVTPEPTTIALYESISSRKVTQKHEIPADQSENLRQKNPGAGSNTILLDEPFFTKKALPTSNLPASSTVFIGREQELDHISALLSDPGCWLLTLLGPGGIGKTCLAVEVGRKHSANFTEGVFFIPLSMVETERSIVPAMARAMGLIFRQNGPTPEEQLLDFLGNKRLLLILDSFEQLVPWAILLEQIHSYAPGIKLLITSRHRLLLEGEWVMEVKGLNYPQDQSEAGKSVPEEAFQRYSALELFQHAVRRNRVSFQASPEDLAAIIQIARLLEGMPLGLELAATWINTLTCQEIAAEISQGLDILESSLVNISERQRSMRAVFDHSWKLLSSREKMIFPRLAVFRGSFSRQAAEQVAGISLRDLSGLVDKSLVRRGVDGRFDLHDLLHQYNAEILERLPIDSLETRHRHCAFYCARLADWNEQLNGIKQGQVLRDIETDLENSQAAWEWAVSQMQFDLLEQAVDGLGMFYLRRARLQEGWETYRNANEVIQNMAINEENMQRTRLSARLLTWQAAFSMNLEHLDEASQLLQEAQRVLDHPQLDILRVVHERIFTLVIQALLANLQHDPTSTINFYQQAFELSRRAKAKSPVFYVFCWRFLMGGSVSRELYLEIEKNLEDVKRSGNPIELGCILYVLGTAELYHGYRMEKAEPLLRESIKNFQLVDDPSTQVMILKTLGYLLLVQGKFADSYSLKQRELAVVQEIGDLRLIGIAHAEIGEVLCHLGKYTEAEGEIRKGMALIKDQSEVEYALRHRYLGDALVAQGKFEEAREAYTFSYRFFQSVDEKGWMFTALTGLSRAELGLEDRSNAWLHARLALQLYSEIRLYSFFVYLTLADIALLLADRGETNMGLELYNLVTRQGYLAQSRWFADLFGKYFEEASARLSVEEQDSAKECSLGSDFSEIIRSVRNLIA